MNIREKVGAGGLGIDLMTAAIPGLIPHQWLWLLLASGVVLGAWSFWPRLARTTHKLFEREMPNSMASIVSEPRIKILNFYAIARDQFGWDFGGQSMDPLDLELGLLQAAADGTVSLFGRDLPDTITENLQHHFVLVKIPAEHFQSYRINAVGFDDNKKTKTYACTGKGVKARYRDIHIATTEALNWLRTNADSYRGVTDGAKAS